MRCFFREAVDDLVLGLFFGQAQSHQLDQLFTGNFADGSFVDQAGVHAVGGQGRAGNDRRMVHDDGVALGVTGAGAVAVDVADKLLLAHVLGHAAGNNVGRAAFAVQVHIEVGNGALVAGGHDLFLDHQAGTGSQITAGLADGIVHTGNLGGFHLHLGAFGQVNDGGGVHDLLAAAVTLAVVLFHIAQLGVFGQPEGVDAVMFGIAAAAVVDAAAGNDGHVGAFSNVEVVVHQVLQAGLAQDYRNVYALVLGEGTDVNVDARFVGLGNDIDVGGGVAARQFAVGADVVSAHRQAVQFGNLFQQVHLNGVHQLRTPSTLSVRMLQAGLEASALPSRAGRISLRAPTFSTWPFLMTTILSAMFRMRS